jgi:N-acetylglucosaminyl-diphospho-decaprenol L-rhamnosyltransferase
MKMKIAAIVLNYFGHGDTIACVESILGQNISRILILDNSVSPAEESALRSRLCQHDSVAIASSEKNLGFAGGVNYALTELGISNYEAFLLLNNDTLAPEKMVDRLAQGLRREHFDLAAPAIRCYPETHRIWSEGNYYNFPTTMNGGATLRNLRGSFHYLTGCCLLVRREVFKVAGLLDDAFFMYGEDVEFCYRASQHGFRYGVIGDAVLFHKASASAAMNSAFYEFHINRGHFLLSTKLTETRMQKTLSLCVKLVILGLRTAIRTIRYGNGNALRGYLRALGESVLEIKRLQKPRGRYSAASHTRPGVSSHA